MLEFISAGGLGEAAVAEPAGAAGEPLLAQGVRMRDALLGELSALPGLEVSVADAGLAPLPKHEPMHAGGAAVQRLATAGVDDLVVWLRAQHAAFDLVWVIAPETDGCLLTLCEAVAPARWIGCSADAIGVSSSKTRTREHLAAQGIPTPQAWAPGLPAPAHPGRWVLKPDDGTPACSPTSPLRVRRWPQPARRTVLAKRNLAPTSPRGGRSKPGSRARRSACRCCAQPGASRC